MCYSVGMLVLDSRFDSRHHVMEVEDVVGDTHIIRNRPLTELFGKVGPACPVKIDGIPGRFRHVGKGTDVQFVAD